MNVPFQRAIDQMFLVEAAGRMFSQSPQAIEDKLIERACAEMRMQCERWMEEELIFVYEFDDAKPPVAKPSLVIRAWAWYMPKKRPQYCTPEPIWKSWNMDDMPF